MPVTLASVDGTFVNPSTYDAGELRRADAALVAQAGISSGLVVTVDASDQVTVTRGSAIISGEDAAAGAGVYRAGTTGNVTGALTARDATNSRIDLVVFRQYDTDVVGSHTKYKAEIEIIEGTPSATPSAPAKPSMSVELAKITVPASGGGSASVDNSGRVSAAAVGAPSFTPPKMVSGSRTVDITANTNYTETVTFPAGSFSSTPMVLLNFQDGSPNDNWVSAFNRTATSFTLAVRGTETKTMVVDYVALGS